MSFTVDLSWPYPQVWPNFRQSHHWRKYERQVAAQRKEAWALTLIAARRAGVSFDGTTPIPLGIAFYPPTRRPYDDDGAVGAMKSARDGIADALKVNDRLFRPTYSYHPPEKPGRITVTIG